MADSDRSHPNHVHQSLDDGGELRDIAHADAGMRTYSAVTDAGAHIEMRGRPPHNEEGVHRVCVQLAEAIARESGNAWKADPSKPPAEDRDVDWYIRFPPDNHWAVQVTRVGPKER
jgi:hypothetical protein